MDNLSRCNDIVNALSNNCKRLVKCADDSVVLATYETKNINSDILKCHDVVKSDSEETLPWVLTDNFRKDLIRGVMDKCGSRAVAAASVPASETAMCRSVLPGLVTIRSRLRQKAAENNDDTITTEDFKAFFEDHLCNNELCVRDAFAGDKPLPPLNVSHPEWFYLPEDDLHGYLDRAIAYVINFLASPASERCYLCDIFFKITEEQDAIDLYGLPEQFRINDTICSLYGRYSIPDGKLSGLKIRSSGKDGGFVSTWKNKTFY